MKVTNITPAMNGYVVTLARFLDETAPIVSGRLLFPEGSVLVRICTDTNAFGGAFRTPDRLLDSAFGMRFCIGFDPVLFHRGESSLMELHLRPPLCPKEALCTPGCR